MSVAMNPQSSALAPCALVMAGGTGGHIFPGLALAQALQHRGWRVHWLGGRGTSDKPSMESKLIAPRGIAFEPVDFSGVRGKGVIPLALLPLRLLQAFWQSIAVLRRVRPDVVVGLGGYITFPGGLMSVLLGKPLLLHEQNSVAGMANRVLSVVADRVYTAFPGALKGSTWVGNPLRTSFLEQGDPATRFATRSGALQLLVMGGSLGARALNDIVPQALARIPIERRPRVLHQSGAGQVDALRANYQAAGVRAEVTAFIEEPAQAMASADLLICRSGASTVTEIAAVGAAAVLVPFPFAVDDHQTANARFLVDQGAGRLLPQSDLNAESLARVIEELDRETLMQWAIKAKKMQKTDATEQLVAACEALKK